MLIAFTIAIALCAFALTLPQTMYILESMEATMGSSSFAAVSTNDREHAYRVRWQQGTPAYESYFFRANHPTRPREAFWIRYTIFESRTTSLCELWFIYFNGTRRPPRAWKREYPLSECVFSVGNRATKIEFPSGIAGWRDTRIHGPSWQLSYTEMGEKQSTPIRLLPAYMYDWVFPKAQALVPQPFTTFTGSLMIDDDDGGESTVDVNDWVGSVNHNWGSKHTDQYAWGQVVSKAQSFFLEVATAQVAIAGGNVWLPKMTLMVLRIDGHTIRLNSLTSALLTNTGVYEFGRAMAIWTFTGQTRNITVDGRITAPRHAFIALPYYNPPGGQKTCLNTKIGDAVVTIREHGDVTARIEVKGRAAFEILTDDIIDNVHKLGKVL